MTELELIDLVFQIPKLYKQRLAKEFALRGIQLAPTHLKVMRLLNEKQPCTAHELAILLERDKAQVTRLLQGLVDQSLIEKRPNPSDKRSQLLLLSDYGQERMDAMQAIASHLQQVMRGEITDGDHQTTCTTLTKVLSNLALKDRPSSLN